MYDSANVTLHSKDLTIDENRTSIVNLSTFQPLPIDTVDYDLQNDFLIIRVGGSDQLRANDRYLLSIPFEAELKTDVIGYYRSSYVDSESGQRSYVPICNRLTVD